MNFKQKWVTINKSNKEGGLFERKIYDDTFQSIIGVLNKVSFFKNAGVLNKHEQEYSSGIWLHLIKMRTVSAVVIIITTIRFAQLIVHHVGNAKQSLLLYVVLDIWSSYWLLVTNFFIFTGNYRLFINCPFGPLCI